MNRDGGALFQVCVCGGGGGGGKEKKGGRKFFTQKKALSDVIFKNKYGVEIFQLRLAIFS